MKLTAAILWVMLVVQLHQAESSPLQGDTSSSGALNPPNEAEEMIGAREFIEQLRNSDNSDDNLSEADIDELVLAWSINLIECSTDKIKEVNTLKQKYAHHTWLRLYFKSLTADLGHKCQLKFMNMLFDAERNIPHSDQDWSNRIEALAKEVAAIEGSWSSGEVDERRAIEMLKRRLIPDETFMNAANSYLIKLGFPQEPNTNEATRQMLKTVLSEEIQLMSTHFAEPIVLFNELCLADPGSLLHFEENSKSWMTNFLIYNSIVYQPIAESSTISAVAGPSNEIESVATDDRDERQRTRSRFSKLMTACLGNSCVKE